MFRLLNKGHRVTSTMKQQQSQSRDDVIVISKRVAYTVRIGWEEGPFMLGGDKAGLCMIS